jgi:hypothetical protein
MIPSARDTWGARFLAPRPLRGERVPEVHGRVRGWFDRR